MQELTDDQLDGLFRKSAEEFDPPFDPAAWQAMQSQLDAQHHAPSGQTLFRRKLIRWGLPPLLLLLIGTGWYVFQNRSTTGDITMVRAPSGKIQHAPARQSDLAATTSKNRLPAEKLHQPGATKPADVASITQAGSSAAIQLDQVVADKPALASTRKLYKEPSPTVVARNNTTATNETRSFNDPSPSNAMTRPANDLARSTNRVAKSTVYQKPVLSSKSRKARTNSPIDYAIETTSAFSKQMVTNELVNKRIATTEPSSPAILESASLPLLTTLSGKPGRWPVYSTLINRSVTAPQSAVIELPTAIKPTLQQPMGLSVRFAISPDLSTIGLRNFSRPGTNVGMLLEYRLASRWSVQAGVIQSTKIYRGSIREYELPPYMKVRPESVNGRCSMLDIPVNLRYDVALRPRSSGQLPSRWFVSGGVTSYIMRKEDYDYNYPDGTHLYPNTPRGWHGKTGKWFSLSQLNLSGGYERSISRKLSWQVEPFVKVPLKGVGYLKINLLSTGAFFSLRYKL